MIQIRSDLAIELCEHLRKHNPEPEGIECKRSRFGCLEGETVTIQSKKGESLFGKPMGHYITLNTGRLWLDDREHFREKVFSLRDFFKDFFEEKLSGASSLLVAGLGNEAITADAIGPVAVKNLIVTRHIRRERPLIFENLGLFELCAVSPGVLGQTGIESADIIQSIVEKIKPDGLIVVDALASRALERLVSTVQISDSGLHPGAGIGNHRPALSPKELGIPVISVGVPTVVDAATLAADAMSEFSHTQKDADAIREKWSENGLNFFVTPKESDQIIRVMGSFIGYGLNLALNESLSFEDMLSLIGG